MSGWDGFLQGLSLAAQPDVLIYCVFGVLLGSFFGALPGTGSTISSFLAYAVERRVSRHPEQFGTGAIEGVAGPEAANNAAAISALVPTLALGIPGDPIMALMLGALVIHGVQPGPLMLEARPDMFWGLIASFGIGNVLLLILNLPLIETNLRRALLIARGDPMVFLQRPLAAVFMIVAAGLIVMSLVQVVRRQSNRAV